MVDDFGNDLLLFPVHFGPGNCFENLCWKLSLYEHTTPRNQQRKQLRNQDGHGLPGGFDLPATL